MDRAPRRRTVDRCSRSSRCSTATATRASACRSGSWPVTIGRAIDCDVVLDDPHVAARHATLERRGRRLSLDGRRHGQRRLVEAAAWPRASESNCRRARCSSLAHAAARAPRRRSTGARAPLVPSPRQRALRARAGAAVHGVDAGEQWLNTDPGGASPTTCRCDRPAAAVAVWAVLGAGVEAVPPSLRLLGHPRSRCSPLVMGVAACCCRCSRSRPDGRGRAVSAAVVAAIGWSAVGAHIGRLLPGVRACWRR